MVNKDEYQKSQITFGHALGYGLSRWILY